MCLINKDYEEFSEYISYTLGVLLVVGPALLIGYALLLYIVGDTTSNKSLYGFEGVVTITAAVFLIILGIGLFKRNLIAYIIAMVLLFVGIIVCIHYLIGTIGTNEHVVIGVSSGVGALLIYLFIGFIISIKHKCYNK